MINHLIHEKYFTPEHLLLAWERLICSNDKDVNDLCSWEVYRENLNNNLILLSQKLLNNQFEPSKPFKYFEPKKDGTQRVKTILQVEDSIVYQAISNIIAKELYQKISVNSNYVLGAILNENVYLGVDLLNKKNPDYSFYKNTFETFNNFKKSIHLENNEDETIFRLETDIVSFFDTISHDILFAKLASFGIETHIIDLLRKCLTKYCKLKNSDITNVGIPQGPAPSYFFANLFLHDLDSELVNLGVLYNRFIDDIKIFSDDKNNLLDILVYLDCYFKNNGVLLNSKKTTIEEINIEKELRRIERDISFYNSINQKNFSFILNNSIKEKNNFPFKGTKHTHNDINNTFDVSYTDDIPDDPYLDDDIIHQDLLDDEYLNDLKEMYGNIIARTENFLKICNPENLINVYQNEREVVESTISWNNVMFYSEVKDYFYNPQMLKVWFKLSNTYYWRINLFISNLVRFPDINYFKEDLLEILNSRITKRFEWVRYQLLSILCSCDLLNTNELKELYLNVIDEKSPLVRMGTYMVLIKNVNIDSHLFNSIHNIIDKEEDLYVKNTLTHLMKKENKEDIVNYWINLN